MKNANHPARRAAWLSLTAPALLAVPALAQDTTSTAPPPVSVTVPQASQTPPPSRESGRPVDANTTNPASRTTIAPGAGDVVDEARQSATRAARAAPARTAPARQVSRVTKTRATTARTPAAAPVAAPVTTTAAPATTAVPAAAPVAATPADTTATPADTATTAKTTTSDSTPPLWPLALVVALIVAVGAFFVMRRRRVDDDEYVEENYYTDEPVVAEPAYVEPAQVEPTYVEPEPVVTTAAAEPAYFTPPAAAVAAAPVAAAAALDHDDPARAEASETAVAGLADEAVVSDAPAEDVAALTEGAPPVRNRPWLEFAMRPIRAGTSADEAMVEIELTVANSGSVEATDVRVSTFMLTDAHASEMERMMVDAPADAAIDPVTIGAGEGTRIDATLAALKSELGQEGHFNPVVVAEARYRLPDGSEGRTAASFVVGVTDAEGGAMMPIDLADRVMRDDVEAQLHGEVEHA